MHGCQQNFSSLKFTQIFLGSEWIQWLLPPKLLGIEIWKSKIGDIVESLAEDKITEV